MLLNIAPHLTSLHNLSEYAISENHEEIVDRDETLPPTMFIDSDRDLAS
jgi:hypothetical protein